MTAAVCGCGHPHLPGQALCFTCDSPVAERWEWIPGYEGHYAVSDQGRTVSYKSPHRLRRELRPATHPAGYRYVTLLLDGRTETQTIHRLVLAAFVGPRPAGMVSRHLNGDPADNRLANLAYGTHAENAQDKKRHGTERTGRLPGAANGRAKLTEDDVREIRRRHAAGEAQRSLAREFRVSRPTLADVVHRKSWRELAPACDLPVPTNVPPAVEPAAPLKAPAGGAQALEASNG